MERGTKVEVSNADRVVFPETGKTKGDVVHYYERIAEKALVHLAERPLSNKRFPKGLAAPGFFQKNVPPHYPESIARFEVPRSAAAAKKHPRKSTKAAPPPDVTVYPVVAIPEHLAYLANQGAIELHVPTARRESLHRPDRIVFDLDPPAGAFDLVRRAAHLVRDALGELGLATVPVATGSKGYHVVAAVEPTVEVDVLAIAIHQMATLVASRHPDDLTIAFRIAQRGKRVFVDWLRNYPSATVVAPWSLRARPRGTVAVPLDWSELDATAPDAFGLGDVDRLVDRGDALADLARTPADTNAFVTKVNAAFEASGLVLETFDRFRS